MGSMAYITAWQTPQARHRRGLAMHVCLFRRYAAGLPRRQGRCAIRIQRWITQMRLAAGSGLHGLAGNPRQDPARNHGADRHEQGRDTHRVRLARHRDGFPCGARRIRDFQGKPHGPPRGRSRSSATDRAARAVTDRPQSRSGLCATFFDPPLRGLMPVPPPRTPCGHATGRAGRVAARRLGQADRSLPLIHALPD